MVKTLFNSSVPRAVEAMGDTTAVLEQFTTQWSVWRFLGSYLPTPNARRFERVMRGLDEFIYGLIAERRAGGKDAGDLLSMLLLAKDDDGNGMSDPQLRDELTTLMVAGLDTTALALSWAFYLLSKNPQADGELEAELDSVLGGRAPRFADLPQLRYTEKVVKETMRLFPPAWVIGREAVNDCEIGGHGIAAGTSLIISPWLKHRDGRHFENPEAFQPKRWTDEFTKQLPRYAYFPFGGGPRICIGNAFAMMEATLVLAIVRQKFRLTSLPSRTVTPWPTITLQPKEGIYLKVESGEGKARPAKQETI